jgi:amino acid transporter
MSIKPEQVKQAGIKTDLRENAMGLPGVLMQGIATIAPAFSILAAFVFTVSLAGLVTPWAYLIAGVILAVQALSTAQVAKEFPSAGGWYTWIARSLEPRSGFFAGWIFTIWLPPVGALTFAFLAKTVLEPAIKQYYGVTIYWWIYVIIGLALVTWWAFAGIKVSERLLIITGAIEIVLMVALAITGLARPGPGGFNASSFSFSNFSNAPNIFLAIVFTIFAYSGWEATGPIAEESRNPKKLIPLGLIGSVLILTLYEVFASWGYLVGIGTRKVGTIPTATAWPVATLAQHVWAGAWILLLFALLNSTIAVSIACFNGGTRTWYAMGRSGVLPAWLGRVSPTRKTPDNAIILELLVNVVAFVLAIIFGVANVFFTWALTITLGLILMYILSNIGVMKYYLGEARSRFNPLMHLVIPVAATIAVGYVGYKSIVPLPAPPVKWAPIIFVVYMAIGAAILIYLRLRGKQEWLDKAGLAMAEPDVAVHEEST